MRWALVAAAAVVSLGAGVGAVEVSPADTGYAVGYDLGVQSLSRLRTDGLEVDLDEVLRGFEDAVRERDGRLDGPARRQVLEQAANAVAKRRAEARAAEDPLFAALVQANLARSRAFHEAYGSMPGVRTLAGGVQCRELAPGGEALGADAERVVVSYEVRLLDGTVVSSESRREMDLGYVWTGVGTALRVMPVGATWEIAVPPSEALGIGGDAPLIGPNETLIAVVEHHGGA